jgi:DNA-directed RNA polymerase subunit RPC12/RpoP
MATGTAFDFIQINVPCSECGKKTKNKNDPRLPLADLVSKKATDCPRCGHSIDLTTTDWKLRISEATNLYSRVKIR